MACKAETMDVDLASAVNKEMTAMVGEEEELRDKVKKMVSKCYRLEAYLFRVAAIKLSSKTTCCCHCNQVKD